MTKPTATPGNGQAELIERTAVDRPVRRVESAVAKAVQAAELDERDLGLAALAVELGAAVDVASRRLDPYGVAAAARELTNALTRLQLDPTARVSKVDDPIADLIAQLTQTDDDGERVAP